MLSKEFLMKNLNLNLNLKLKWVMAISLIIAATSNIELAHSYGHGISAYPFAQDVSMVTTELIGHMSNGKGMGLQARYGRKFNQFVSIDGGVGFSDSNRSGRVFVATDIEIFPDYEHQPRFSLKPFFENAMEYKKRKSIFGISPLFSKGFPVLNQSVHPFVSLPIGLTLNTSNNSYEMRSTVAMGVTGKVPLEGMENVIFNLEGNINIAKSFSGIFLGFSYALN